MNETQRIFGLAGLITAALWLGHVPPDAGRGQATQPAAEPATPAATQPADADATADEASPDAVIRQLMRHRREGAPVIEPTRSPDGSSPPPDVSVPPAPLEIDPAIIGVAPGEDMPPLRREGEFIVNRRGRLIHAAGGQQLFVFEADGKGSPELPMIIQPCRRLEDMERIVSQRGDDVVFILSGQVHTYRGANYLLPTMMKIAFPKGNLEMDS